MDGVYTPRRMASGGTSPAHTWILDSHLQDRETANICCLKTVQLIVQNQGLSGFYLS